MMLLRELNEGHLEIVILHSFFSFSRPLLGWFSRNGVFGGFFCAFSYFFLVIPFLFSLVDFSRVRSVVLKVFRYHWGNWALVEIALHFHLELVIYKLMFTYWWRFLRIYTQHD